MIRITYYRDKCIGCGACVEAAPDRWRMSRKDGKCNLIKAIEKKGIYSVICGLDELEANDIAAKNCPVKIIQVKNI